MTQTMNNMELTRGFEALQAQVNDLSTRLATAIPEIENSLKVATTETKSLYDSIRSDTLPISRRDRGASYSGVQED